MTKKKMTPKTCRPSQDVVITQDVVIKWAIGQLMGDQLTPKQRVLLEDATIAVASLVKEVITKR